MEEGFKAFICSRLGQRTEDEILALDVAMLVQLSGQYQTARAGNHTLCCSHHLDIFFAFLIWRHSRFGTINSSRSGSYWLPFSYYNDL